MFPHDKLSLEFRSGGLLLNFCYMFGKEILLAKTIFLMVYSWITEKIKS